jgi:hypothetical protein
MTATTKMTIGTLLCGSLLTALIALFSPGAALLWPLIGASASQMALAQWIRFRRIGFFILCIIILAFILCL